MRELEETEIQDMRSLMGESHFVILLNQYVRVESHLGRTHLVLSTASKSLDQQKKVSDCA